MGRINKLREGREGTNEGTEEGKRKRDIVKRQERKEAEKRKGN